MGNTERAVLEAVSVIDYLIGENVDTLRKRRGYTNETLGAEFGLTGPAISLKLRGKRAWSAADVKFAADLLGVRMAVLYGEEPMPEPGSDINITSIASRTRKTRPVTDLKQSTLAPVTGIFDRQNVAS